MSGKSRAVRMASGSILCFSQWASAVDKIVERLRSEWMKLGTGDCMSDFLFGGQRQLEKICDVERLHVRNIDKFHQNKFKAYVAKSIAPKHRSVRIPARP